MWATGFWPLATPGDLTFSMSGGMVSSVNRTINVDGTPFNMIQTDTSINPGNSGGPLLNSYGEVVGIVSAKYSSYGSSGESVEGLGFAIPINDVISMIQDIMTNGYVSNKAYLGATIGTLTSGMAQQYRYDISQGCLRILCGGRQSGGCGGPAAGRRYHRHRRHGDHLPGGPDRRQEGAMRPAIPPH